MERGADQVVITPFFLSPGRHTLEDIPRLAQEAVDKCSMDISFSIADPLGTDPLIVEILQQRVDLALVARTAGTETYKQMTPS